MTARRARASSSRSGPDERALDVFHHPFAYAAFRDAARKRQPAVRLMEVPDGTVWTGRHPLRPGSPPRAVVVRVRNQGWTSVDFDIEHAYGGPVGGGRGSASPQRSSRAGSIAFSDAR